MLPDEIELLSLARYDRATEIAEKIIYPSLPTLGRLLQCTAYESAGGWK